MSLFFVQYHTIYKQQWNIQSIVDLNSPKTTKQMEVRKKNTILNINICYKPCSLINLIFKNKITNIQANLIDDFKMASL